MSNFFGRELRKLFAGGTIIRDPVFMGRAYLGSLDRNRQMRAEFVTLGHVDYYAALHLTLLNNNHGVADELILWSKDIWGKKKIPNNPYLRDGVAPHIWVDGNRTDWYVCHLSQEDYQQFRQIASDYVEILHIQVLTKNHDPRLIYICAPLRDELEKNIAFAKEKAQEVFWTGDVPICPHLTPPSLADPDDPVQDRTAWEAGLRLVEHCQRVNVYGTVRTPGMLAKTRRAEELNIPVKTDQSGSKKRKDRPKRGQIRQEVKWQKSR